MAKTQNIPIARNYQKAFEEQLELHQETLIADYKDYIFYSRLLEGMQEKQDKTSDRALRYENQALIDHIVRTRHGWQSSVYEKDSNQNLPGHCIDLESIVHDVICLTSNEENEDMIFEIDL